MLGRSSLTIVIAAAAALAAVPAEAKTCFKKGGVGNALTEDLARVSGRCHVAAGNRLVDLLHVHQRQRHAGLTFGPRALRSASQRRSAGSAAAPATLCKLD